MEIILTALLVVIIGAVSVWYAVYYKYEKYLVRYRGPALLPVIGSTHHFASFECKYLYLFLLLSNEAVTI